MVQHAVPMYASQPLLLYFRRRSLRDSVFLLLRHARREADSDLSSPTEGCVDRAKTHGVDALAPQRRALLWRKLLICGIRFDFSHEDEVEARDMKRNTLLELMDASESMGWGPPFLHDP